MANISEDQVAEIERSARMRKRRITVMIVVAIVAAVVLLPFALIECEAIWILFWNP